ncbi:hypothetical protein ACFFRR_011530 [Megaselia abdita]
MEMDKSYEQIKWPSERIPQKGLFHNPPKIEYSKETTELIKLMMEESRLSMMLQKQINYHLRNGEPLPVKSPEKKKSNMDENARALEIMKRARVAKRKSLDSIIASGAYDQQPYRPKPNGKFPSEKAKKDLQEKMSGIRISTGGFKPTRRPSQQEFEVLGDEERINEMLEQIEERAEWLAEMEELGEGKKYRDEIRNQIADKLRAIKMIERKKQTKQSLQEKGFRYIE